MSFRPVTKNKTIIGYAKQINNDLLFFGTQSATLSTLEESFPNLQFHRLEQVHGDRLVECSPHQHQADAHWTSQSQCAPIVATADCIPILITHPHFQCSIHAGWRGVQNEITMKTLDLLFKKFGNQKDALVAIGPHIQCESFEVDLPLALQFQKQLESYGESRSAFFHSTGKVHKAYVDLSLILRTQLFLSGVVPENTFEFSANTVTDERFSSFRRQKKSLREI